MVARVLYQNLTRRLEVPEKAGILFSVVETRLNISTDVQCTKKALMQFADNAGTGQPARVCRLIWLFAVCLQN